jgi:hypothetical protein
MSTFLKMAGGRKYDDEISIEEFQKQARDYETQGNVADRVWQVINTAFRTHPFGTVRAAELQRWIDSGDYDKIVTGGDYRRRNDAAKPSLGSDLEDAAGYYGDQAKEAMATISGVLNRAKDAFDNAFKTSSEEK